MTKGLLQKMTSSDPSDITFPVVATLDDQLKLNEFLLRQPKVRRQRLIRLVLGLTIYPLVGLGIGFAAASFSSGHAPTSATVLDMLTDDPWTSLLLPWASIATVIGLLWFVFRLLRRPLLRLRIARLLKDRPGVDANDPALAEHVRCTFGTHGYTVESSGYTHKVPWTGIKAVDETADLLVVKTSLWTGYVVPKRDISPAHLAAVRALAARQLNPPPGPWGKG